MAMTTRLHSFWQSLVGQQADQTGSAVRTLIVPRSRETGAEAVDIAPNDPLVAYFQASPGVVEVDRLNLDSPAAHALKEAGVRMAVPLVSQGEVVGLLNLGQRLSEQEYSTDDRRPAPRPGDSGGAGRAHGAAGQATAVGGPGAGAPRTGAQSGQRHPADASTLVGA